MHGRLYIYTTSMMSLVKPLFVASIASLTMAMTSMASTIQLMQQMGGNKKMGGVEWLRGGEKDRTEERHAW